MRLLQTSLLVLAAAAVQIISTANSALASASLLFSIQIENRHNGAVRIRMHGSSRWMIVGRVTEPATLAIPTFAAASYSRVSSVAAIAVHGIRIRVPGNGPQPLGISIQPREFRTMPTGYGGHNPGRSAIITDIQAGTVIFRDFSPLVGDPVTIERSGGLTAIPDGWTPSEGDVIQIDSFEPQDLPVEFIFENRPGGLALSLSTDGKQSAIGQVVQPLCGVGRFDATSYTGVGAVNTNHGGVITISTATAEKPLDEGLPPETRGGFEIQPSQHYNSQPRMPQAMIIAPIDRADTLEGRYPLFSGAIGLGDGTPVVYMRFGNSPWQPVPRLIGKIDDAFTSQGAKRLGISDDGGLTAIKLLRQPRQAAKLNKLLSTIGAPEDLSSHQMKVDWQLKYPYPEGSAYVIFSSAGRTLAISNTHPYYYSGKVSSGTSALRAEFISSSGKTLQSRTGRISFVKGRPQIIEFKE